MAEHRILEELYKRHEQGIRRLLVRLVGEADAEDLTHDVFERAQRALGTYRAESLLSTWLYRIATHMAIDVLRSRAVRERERHASEAAIPTFEASFEPAPDREVERNKTRACILRLIQRLPTTQQAVLILSEIRGLSDREASEALGITLSSAKIRLHRARKELRALVKCECSVYRDERNDARLTLSFSTKAAECGACHPKQYQQWRYGAGTDLDNGGAGSYHALSSTDGMYQVMLAKMQPDMQSYCRGCHEAGNAWAVPDKINLIPQPRTLNVEEGVSCVVCHFDGTKIVSRAAMQDPLLCATCHNENTGLVEIYDEWVRDYTGGKTCQECHMPDANHAAPGFHGTSFIRQALVANAPVFVGPVTAGVPFNFRFSVTNAGTGHSVPEDLFRLVTVKATILDGSSGELYECVKTYYKRNALFGEDPATTEVLKSGETATIECGGAIVPSPGPYTVRIEMLQDSNRVDAALNYTVFMGSTYGSFFAN